MGTPALWIIFNAGVLLLLVLDLGVLNRRAHEVSMREAAIWSVFWVALSIGFNLWILQAHGGEKALQFFTGYIIEQSMSVDNIFIFILVFRSFGVESRYQHRVLFWGILGALILRGAMIGLGTALVRKFEWTLYILAAFLVVAAIRMLFRNETEPHPERSRLLRWTQTIFPVSHNYHGQKLWIREAGKRMATPLLLVLLVIEATDFVFALDSIPAVFGVSRDPFIVYSSNICAILGLRAFYFLLAGLLPAFRYLDEGLSVVLLFVGAKMLVVHWIEIPTAIALGIIAAILAISILASIIAMRLEKQKTESGSESKSGEK
jgi:TerC family integral membrane protein